MRLPDGSRLVYTLGHKAWYAQANGLTSPELTVTAAMGDGGCAWEFMVREHDLGRDERPIRIDVFDDSFEAYAQIPEFFIAVGVLRPTGIAQVVDILSAFGAVDETPYVRPDRGLRQTTRKIITMNGY